MSDILYKKESYEIIGICMEVHRILGMGFSEIIYKDALVIEFLRRNVPFVREKYFQIEYKGITLPHQYFADFVLYDSIILEVKASAMIMDKYIAQTLNYLKVADLRLGIVANFGEKSFTYKRVII